MSNYKDSDYIEDNDYSQLIKAFEDGYDKCQKEYEEKLRWIPVAEKMPEINKYGFTEELSTKNEYGITNQKGYKNAKGKFTWCDTPNVTHWRYFL